MNHFRKLPFFDSRNVCENYSVTDQDFIEKKHDPKLQT